MSTAAATISHISSLKASHQSSVRRLAEPLLPSGPAQTANSSEHAVPTPQSLRTDLEHYKLLFSKLRFSYLEQVTKERFLRSIVGDPPLVVESADCADLETRLVSEKAKLKAQKEEVRLLVEELEYLGNAVTTQYNQLSDGGYRLASIESEIEEIHQGIAELKNDLPEDAEDPNGWSLAHVQRELIEKHQQADNMDRRLDSLQSDVPRQADELEKLKNELQQLEVQRLGSISAANDAKRRKEGRLVGGTGDEVEERARWLRAQESILGKLLEVG